MIGLELLKAHGTGNDFIIVPDADGAVDLRPAMVAALCDRRTGIGADGILRVVRSESCDDPAANGSTAEFFMDYRNADGSLAQMCGNGARVFAEYLVKSGLAPPGQLRFGTRGGDRAGWADGGGDVTVSMGTAEVRAGTVVVDVGKQSWPATAVSIPNPHAVAIVDDVAEAGPLQEPPVLHSTLFPEGANVEFLQILADRHARMRVHERGVGETLSCGTGACAAAVVLWRSAGGQPEGPAMARIDVPGGSLGVERDQTGEITLSGPVEFVARLQMAEEWWQRVVHQ